MAEGERPSKMRKLSHDDMQSVNTTLQSSDRVTENGTGEVSTNGTEHGTDVISNQAYEPHTAQASAGSDDAVETGADVEVETHVGDALPPPDATAPLATDLDKNVEVGEDPPLSKNQQKKLRKKLEWEAGRDERKMVRKDKEKAKREQKRAVRDEARAANGEDISKPPARLRKQPGPKPALLPITFLIDCDFDDLMADNERISLAAQITRCYSDNKNSLFRAHLTVCSFGGQLRERFDNILTHYKCWRGVRFLDCAFVEAAAEAEKWMLDAKGGNKLVGALQPSDDLDDAALEGLKKGGEVVYLSSESDETLTELKPYSTYIIGGLVDKNREKGICYKRAMQRGVRTARLPIGEFMEMTSRKVLATNHVNEIMLKWLECGDWGQAFLKVIPKRKGVKLRDAADEAEEANGDDDDHSNDRDDALAESVGIEDAATTVGAAPVADANGGLPESVPKSASQDTTGNAVEE